jgi:choline-sulfatase
MWLVRRGDDRTTQFQRLNVVLITIDTLRADRIGRGLTPAIDSVAARGVSFPNVRATVPLTLPSHVSLLTGTIPPVHGVRENGVVFDRKRPTIAKIFREGGYATGAFVGAYVLNRRFGLDEGFDVYDDAVRRDPARSEALEAERRGSDVVDAALAYVGRASQARRPFFMWIHLYDPHAPYEPPAEFLKKANGNAYDGEVAYADAQVGRLLAALDERGLTNSTAIAITGDHGESLGEHGERTHGMLVYDAALRVPMILAAPGFEAAGGDPCHVHVANGLLALAGIPITSVPESLRPIGLLRRQGDSTIAESIECDGYAESVYPRRAGWHGLTATHDSRWKLVASSERELYDLQSDPKELRNVAAQHPATVQAMAAVLAKVRPASSAAPKVSADAAERLRALGYVAGSAAVRTDDPSLPNPSKHIAAWTEFERALGLLQSGNAAGAAGALKALAAQHPGAPVFQSTYAQALRQSGDARGALAIYKAAVTRWPTDATLFHDLAVAAREAGDTQEAIRAEQAALAIDATSAMAHNGLGLLHAETGRAADAVAAFERATAADPTNPSYWANLGNARRESGSVEGAEAAYRKALEIDASHADAANGLGVLLVQRRRAADAIPFFERALAASPDFHEARLNLGIAYQESGQREKAAAVYREILTRAPKSADRERRAAADLLKSLR